MEDVIRNTATRYRIHPGLGIARLGDSLNEFFIGPESPDWRPEPNGGYKDALGKIKRQAARFRIYEYDADGIAVREITEALATITWTVHLANKKAAWYEFVGRYKWEDEAERILRNKTIQADLPPDQRTDLIIDPGPRSISGYSAAAVRCDGGKFLGKSVDFGEIQTDQEGRLLVLGGHGKSNAALPNKPIHHYANNDGWHDDSADGPVSARITFSDGTSFDADPAWVIVAPPKFAPQIDNMVTLDDVVREATCAEEDRLAHTGVTFYGDIFPILRSAANYPWVSAVANRGHGSNAAANFMDPDLLAQLSNPESTLRGFRQSIFRRMRTPLSIADDETAQRQATAGYMPILSGDDGDATTGKPRTWLTLLPRQYQRMKAWADGEFTAGTMPVEKPLALIDIADQPASLDRGALQPCVGGPFYPGIEMTFISTDPSSWRAPYRITAEWGAGDVTKWMAVPWQADFFECNFHWWPAQRPDDVLPEAEYEASVAGWESRIQSDGEANMKSVAKAVAYRAKWARGLPATSPEGDAAMVTYWSELGFVVRQKAPSGETVYVERQRRPGAGMDVRELFYKLMNIDNFPEILPKAKQYAEQCLAFAQAYQKDSDTPDIFRPFTYTAETFQARMLETYSALVQDVEIYDPATAPLFKTREDVVERIRQFAPFNMSDGSWLRNITRIGPIDETRALLFSVLMDEIGDGEVSHNHSNIYRDLCHSVGFYPSDCTSVDFAYSADFLTSAFDLPTFELAISQFSETWYPELMGMTLQLELGIVEAKNTISLMQYFGFDAKYWVMHVGIDNPVNGHAQRAMRAISLYLDGVRANGGGEDAVQKNWQRIWNGFVAFATVGTFGSDFDALLAKKPTLDDQVQAMIERKAEFGSMNHDRCMLGNTPINDLFLDPPAFMQALINGGFFIPGDPDNSPFFRLTSFDTGRMYRVFTDDELKLWADWCRSLGQVQPTPPQPNAYADMVQVVRVLRYRQTGTPGHQSALLKAPDTGRAYPVAWWFQQPSRDFLEALAWPDNHMITPGKPDESHFVTALLAPSNAMGAAFADTMPGLGNRTGREVAIAWIAAGCPVPPKPMQGSTGVLWLASSKRVRDAHPTGRIVGLGAIH